jgi:hypothetical protein
MWINNYINMVVENIKFKEMIDINNKTREKYTKVLNIFCFR